MTHSNSLHGCRDLFVTVISLSWVVSQAASCLLNLITVHPSLSRPPSTSMFCSGSKGGNVFLSETPYLSLNRKYNYGSLQKYLFCETTIEVYLQILCLLRFCKYRKTMVEMGSHWMGIRTFQYQVTGHIKQKLFGYRECIVQIRHLTNPSSYRHFDFSILHPSHVYICINHRTARRNSYPHPSSSLSMHLKKRSFRCVVNTSCAR